MEAGREPAGAPGAVGSAGTVSYYCHACVVRFSLPAPSSPFHFTLCPRCRRDYLDDSPAPQPAWLPPPPPPPPPCAVTWPSDPFTSSLSSSSFTTRPRTLVASPCTGPSSSSTRPPGSATSSTAAPVTSYCPERSVACREFRLLCSHEEQRRSPTAGSPLSSPYSTACSSPLLASPPPPPPPPFHRVELLPQSFPLTLRSSTAEETASPSQDLLPPPPPPWLPLASADTWEYFLDHSDTDSDDEIPPRPPPPPPPPPVPLYDATFDMPPPSPAIAANDSIFEFDPPLQHGGSQAAPPESIAALPTVTVTDTGLGCAVCIDPLPLSAPVRRLPCGHRYHSDCIITWLSRHNSCPVCRRSIPMITSATSDIGSSSSSSRSPGRRRRRSLPVPGGRRIRRICSRLLRNFEIGRDRQTSSSRDEQTNSSGDVHV